jgi:DNA-binding NarL/FixJ family response regulator
MNGYATAQKITKEFPEVKILALSVEDDEECIIRMLRCGSKGYLLKNTPTTEFKIALHELYTKGYYHSDLVSNTLMNLLKPKPKNAQPFKLKINFQAREEEFLHFACSELTYKEIAGRMCLSPRTIDGYRENFFYKLQVKSRVGMVLFAIKNGVVEV